MDLRPFVLGLLPHAHVGPGPTGRLHATAASALAVVPTKLRLAVCNRYLDTYEIVHAVNSARSGCKETDPGILAQLNLDDRTTSVARKSVNHGGRSGYKGLFR